MSAIQLTIKAGFPGDVGNTTHYKPLAEPGRSNEWDINLIIKQYHIDARKNIVVIYDLAQNVFGKQSEKHPELAKLTEALFLFFDDLSFHLTTEEQILFPNILQLNEQKTYSETIDCATLE